MLLASWPHVTDALKGPGKSLIWSLALDSTFCRVKKLLANIPKLVQPCLEVLIYLAMDASDSHIGSAPLALCLRKLSDVKKKYSAFDC